MRVFYDENGRIYKAKDAKSPTHSEMNFPPQDILDVLVEGGDPISREEMIAKINHPDFPRKQAVLAQEREKSNA